MTTTFSLVEEKSLDNSQSNTDINKYKVETKAQSNDDDIKIMELQPANTTFPRLKVYTALNVYEVGEFDLENSTVSAHIDYFFAYDDEIYNTLYDRGSKCLPWALANALEMEMFEYKTHKVWASSLNAIHFWAKKTTEEDYNAPNKRLYRIEIHSARVTLQLTTFASEDPFQTIFLVFKFSFGSAVGCEYGTWVKASDYFMFFPGCRQRISGFKKGEQLVREFTVTADYGEFSRLYYIFEYNKVPTQDIAKFYILPMLINCLTVAFYNDVDSLFDSAGSYFLAIIALLFTLPESGAFTRNEKAVVFGAFWMLIVLVVLRSFPSDIAQATLGSLIIVSYSVLLAFDYYYGGIKNGKYRDILFNGDLTELDAI